MPCVETAHAHACIVVCKKSSKKVTVHIVVKTALLTILPLGWVCERIDAALSPGRSYTWERWTAPPWGELRSPLLTRLLLPSRYYSSLTNKNWCLYFCCWCTQCWLYFSPQKPQLMNQFIHTSGHNGYQLALYTMQLQPRLLHHARTYTALWLHSDDAVMVSVA